MKLSIEQHELRALVNNVNEMLPFIEANECEKAIQALLPLLENAIDTKERLENEDDDDIEEKKGKDLLKAILERRASSKKPEKKKIEKKDKKRNREQVKESEAFESEWDAESEPLWAPYNLEKAPGIIRVDSFNKQRGEFGLFLHAHPNWQQQTFAFFANAESLKPIDDLYSKKFRKVTAILKRDICKMKKTPELVQFLKKFEWGKSLLDSF